MYEYNGYNPNASNILGFQNNSQINLGNIGYNNMSYYSGNYNYYNPYLIQQQQQQVQHQQQQQYNDSMAMFNRMDQIARNFLGIVPVKPEDYMPSPEEQKAQYERYMELQNMEYLSRVDQTVYINYTSINHANSFVNNLENSINEHPKESESAADTIKMLGKRSMEIADKELSRFKISGTYNKNQFNQLLKRDADTNYFASTFSNINVDDMTHNISIPSTEYIEKKKKFMDFITRQIF